MEDPRWLLTERVAASRHFTKATQLHDFLLFIALRTLEGRESELHEFNIGCAVLGRDDSFSPSEDNIVRVQARHLRKKVEDYFANEGRHEPLIITIPKGGYVPHFDRRPEHLPTEPPPHSLGNHNHHRSLWLLSGAAVGILASVAIWLLLAAQPPRATSPLLAEVFRDGQETNIVVADSCLAVIQDILGTDITLAEYMEPGFRENMLARAPDGPLRAAISKLFSRQYTSLGDLNIASRIMREAQTYPGSARLRYARHLSLREFKTSNFILLGSRRSIPWDGLFEDKLNFHPVWEPGTGAFYFRNRKPERGERAEYGRPGGASEETYATIALLPNLDRTGNVLLLTGLTMEGTEAVGEFIMSPGMSGRLHALLAKSVPDGPGIVEVLVRLSVVGGASRDPAIVAARPIGRY